MLTGIKPRTTAKIIKVSITDNDITKALIEDHDRYLNKCQNKVLSCNWNFQ
jgi:hypothetical protein